jgi:hypothetical protein
MHPYLHKKFYSCKRWVLQTRYVPRFRPRNVSSDMFLGWSRNISSYVPRCHVAEEHKLYSSALLSVQSYIRQDIFLSYVPWFCSPATNICSSGFGRGTFVLFPVVYGRNKQKGSTLIEIWQNKIRSLRKYLRGWAKNMIGA